MLAELAYYAVHAVVAVHPQKGLVVWGGSAPSFWLEGEEGLMEGACLC